MDEIHQNWSFEVVTIPQDNTQPGSTSNTPINIKIKVKKGDNTDELRHGFISVSKLKAKHRYSKKIRVVKSDQTIMSFNMIVQPEHKTKPRRSTRNKFFHLFTTGKCLGIQNEDEVDPPYMLTNSTKTDEVNSQSLLGSNNYILKNTSTIITSGKASDSLYFLGKCKRGGCLDPPFGEDRHPYQPSRETQVASLEGKQKEKYKNDKKLIGCKSIHSEVTVKIAISMTEVECNEPSAGSTLMLYKSKTEQCSLNEKYSNSIITYPVDSSSTVLNENISNKKNCVIKTRQISDVTDTYFIPKINKSPERNSNKLNNNQNRDLSVNEMKQDHVFDVAHQLIPESNIITRKSYITTETSGSIAQPEYNYLQLPDFTENELVKVKEIEDPLIYTNTDSNGINTLQEMKPKNKSSTKNNFIQDIGEMSPKEDVLVLKPPISDNCIHEDFYKKPLKLKSAILTQIDDDKLLKNIYNTNVIKASSCEDIEHLSTIPTLTIETEKNDSSSLKSLKFKHETTLSTKTSVVSTDKENFVFEKQDAISQSNLTILEQKSSDNTIKRNIETSNLELKHNFENFQGQDLYTPLDVNSHLDEKKERAYKIFLDTDELNSQLFDSEDTQKLADTTLVNTSEKTNKEVHEIENNEIEFLKTQNNLGKILKTNASSDIVIENAEFLKNESRLSNSILIRKTSKDNEVNESNDNEDTKLKQKKRSLIIIYPIITEKQDNIVNPIIKKDHIEGAHKYTDNETNEKNYDDESNEKNATTINNFVSKNDDSFSMKHKSSNNSTIKEDATVKAANNEITISDNLSKKDKIAGLEFKNMKENDSNLNKQKDINETTVKAPLDEMQNTRYHNKTYEIDPLDKYIRDIIEKQILGKCSPNFSFNNNNQPEAKDILTDRMPVINVLQNVNKASETFEKTTSFGLENDKEIAASISLHLNNSIHGIGDKGRVSESFQPQSNELQENLHIIEDKIINSVKTSKTFTENSNDVELRTPLTKTKNNIVSPVDIKEVQLTKNNVYDNELLFSVSKVEQTKETSLIETFETHSKNNKPLMSKPSLDDVLNKTMILDLGYQIYRNENNEIILKTFNASKEPRRFLNDNVSVIRKRWNMGDNKKILFDIDSKTQLSLQHNNKNNSIKKGGKSFKVKENSIDANCPDKENNQNSGETDIKLLHESLAAIYENDLIPVEKIIKSLILEIKKISKYRTLLRKKYIVTKKPKALKPMYTNKCFCLRK